MSNNDYSESDSDYDSDMELEELPIPESKFRTTDDDNVSTDKIDDDSDSEDAVQTTANIPMECLGYKIRVRTNICNMVLKDPTVVKFVKGLESTTKISKKNKTITFTFDLNSSQQHIFNKLFDKSEHTIEGLTNAIMTANDFFEDYEVSRQTQNYIDRYIATTGRSDEIWEALTSKPDYNLCTFKKRTLPYFHLGNKDWVKANIDALQGNYSEEIKQAVAGKVTDKIQPMSTRNNNFLEWGVLPVDRYPDTAKLANRIKIFYRLGLQRQALILFMKLMLSPRDCHIVKESSLWKIFKSHMDADTNVNEIVKYCYYFAMYILRQEETVMFSQVNDKYRVLFTLEEASALPVFKNTHLERNPYVLQMTDDTRLSDCIPFHVTGTRKINSTKEFERRFALATAGIFKGIDLKQLGASIAGSILVPCVHTSPLEKGFGDVDWTFERESIKLKHPYMVDNPTSDEDFAFLNYLEYYYPGYCSLTDDDFAAQVLNQKTELIEEEELMYEEEDVTTDQQTTMEPSATIVHDSTLIENTFETPEADTPDIPDISEDTVIINAEDAEVKDDKEVTAEVDDKEVTAEVDDKEVTAEVDDKEVTAEVDDKEVTPAATTTRIIIEEYDSDDKDEKKSEPIPTPAAVDPSKTVIEEAVQSEQKDAPKVAYNQLSDIDISITTRDTETFKTNALSLYHQIQANCVHRGEIFIKEIKTIASTKFKIFGPGLSRPIDVFRIPYGPAKMVKKFHVPCVKMYYDNQITMFRTCISALLSGIGESYKWFSCNKIPIDVLLKYAQRGITIILNSRERDAVSKFLKTDSRWGEALRQLHISPKKIYCCVTADHPFFHPGMHKGGIRKTLRNFQRDINSQYTSSLVVPMPTSIAPFGDLPLKDNNKQYPPNPQMIYACMDYVANTE